MDKEELCFIIDGRSIYLEKILVDYQDVPVFFLCNDGRLYYLSLCTNMDDYDYYVIQLSEDKVHALLHGELPMRDIILGENGFWEVKSGADASCDIVAWHGIDAVNRDNLPEEGARFQVLTKDMAEYVNSFDSRYFRHGFIMQENDNSAFSYSDCVVLPPFNINNMFRPDADRLE